MRLPCPRESIRAGILSIIRQDLSAFAPRFAAPDIALLPFHWTKSCPNGIPAFFDCAYTQSGCVRRGFATGRV